MWKLSGEGKQPADTVVFYVGEEPVYLDEVNLYCLENVVQLGLTTNQLDSVTAEDGRSASEYYKDEILTLIMNYITGKKLNKHLSYTLPVIYVLVVCTIKE